MNLEIVLKPGSDTPIYMQIEEQIRSGVLSGQLEPQTPIPSIRSLAKMLRVSVITVQKAYEDLKREGYIESVVGRGTVIADVPIQTIRETRMKELESLLEQVCDLAKECDLSFEDLCKTLKMMMRGEEE